MENKLLIQAGEEFNTIDSQGNPMAPFTPFAARGPQMIQTNKGTILCFSIVKFDSQADEAEDFYALRRSFDNGETWGAIQYLKMCGVPVYDAVNDTVVVFCRTRHWKKEFEEDRIPNETDQINYKVDERYWITKSADDGATWSEYKEVEIAGIPDTWSVRCCPTPGLGIQLKHQKDPAKNGRLVIPCNRAQLNNGDNEFRAQLVYSDDFGDSWKVGALQDLEGANESVVVELVDGTLLHNCRNQHSPLANVRIQGRSYDGGETMAPGTSTLVESLYDPVCHGGFAQAVVEGKEYVFFSIPDDDLTPRDRWGRRSDLCLMVSVDGGYTYQYAARHITADDHFSAYSNLLVTDNGKLIVCWESGPSIGEYRTIEYTTYDLKELVSKL